MEMMRTPPEKSSSVPDMALLDDKTPQNYLAAARYKRKREDEFYSTHVHDMMTEIKNELKLFFNGLIENQNTQINTILSTLKDIHQTSNLIQTTITNLTEENQELKSKVEELEIKSKIDKEQIVVLESKIEALQRNERKTSIEIKNVPLKGDENKKDLLKMVTTLCSTLKVQMETGDVKDILKIKKPKSERSSLIVEFNSSFTKTDLLKAAKTYNHTNSSNKLSAYAMGITKNADTPIFISENLTPMASRLYFLARDFRSTNKYKYCWTSFGKVYLRMDDNTPIINITRENQFQGLPKQ